MPGYDTIRLWLPKEKVKNTELLSEIPCLLKNVKEIHYQKTDISCITGNLENFKVQVNERSVSLIGSLCKYGLGNNIETLNRQKTKEAITKLSDELHLPIKEATITRIDLAENLPMNFEVSFYYSFLGQVKYYDRLEQNNGVNYRNGVKEMLFYDKIHEQKINRAPIPDLLKESNLLRYEFRFKNHLRQQLKLNEVKADILYNENFYFDIVNKWKSEYLKISKHKLHNLELKTFNNMKQFEKLLLLNGINSLGGEAVMLQIIEQAKRQGVFKNKMQEKRLKDKVKFLCKTPQLSFESDAIKELDKKINQVMS